jgi:hypothetical protein
MKRILTSIALALAVSLSAAAAPPEPSLQTRNPSLKIQWAGDQAHTPAFDKVLLAPVELEFRPVAPLTGPPGAPTSRTEYPVADEHRQDLAQTFGEIFREELGRNKHFTLTDQSGPGVLVVKPSLRDIVSHVPPEEPPGRSKIYVDSVGDVTLVVELVDPVTGTTLGSATDRRTAQPTGTTFGDFGAVRATPPSTTQEVRQLARRWATSLDKRLEQLYFDAKPK